MEERRLKFGTLLPWFGQLIGWSQAKRDEQGQALAYGLVLLPGLRQSHYGLVNTNTR